MLLHNRSTSRGSATAADAMPARPYHAGDLPPSSGYTWSMELGLASRPVSNSHPRRQSPWSRGPRAKRRLVAGILLLVVPVPLAVLFLILGLSNLALVYVSIAASVASIPCFAFGVVLIVRRNAVPDGYVFTPPPGWPLPPAAHWSPPAGWQPDPSWPPPPDNWDWWQLAA